MTSTPRIGERGRGPSTAAWGLAGAVALAAVAMAVPAATGWYVRVHDFPPLHAQWRPRLGPGTLPAVVLAIVVGRWAVDAAERWARAK